MTSRPEIMYPQCGQGQRSSESPARPGRRSAPAGRRTHATLWPSPVRSIRKSTPPPSIAIGSSVRLMTRIAPPNVVAPTEQRSRLDVLVEVEQVVRVVAPLCLQQPRVVAAVVLHHSRLVIPGREVDIATGLRVRGDRGVV